MQENLRQLKNNTKNLKPDDLLLALERLRNHVVQPRMSAEQLTGVIQQLGFESVEEFGAHIGIGPRTAQSWARYGLSHDTAQLLLAFLSYAKRLREDAGDFERITQIPLDSFVDLNVRKPDSIKE